MVRLQGQVCAYAAEHLSGTTAVPTGLTLHGTATADGHLRQDTHQNKKATMSMSLSDQSRRAAKKLTTDEKLMKLFEQVYVQGYRAGVWDTTEKALKTLIHERNKAIPSPDDEGRS